MDTETTAPISEETNPIDLNPKETPDDVKQIRTAALSLLEKGQTSSNITDLAAAVDKAGGALKQAAEMEKTRQELEKLSQEILGLRDQNALVVFKARSERMRDYIALLTPLVTIVTLASTLIVQNWQFLRAERTKREEALDAQWQDTVKAISSSGALSPAVISLQPFLHSEKYGDQARGVALNLLENSSDSSFFHSIFGTVLTPVTESNIDRIVGLNRALVARGNPIFTKSYNKKTGEADFKRLSKDELAANNYVLDAFSIIASQIAAYMRTKRQGTQIDLSGTHLSNGDFSGIDFGETNLAGIAFYDCDIQNADLSEVTQFEGADFYGTAWWKAKAINPTLLQHLRTKNAFEPKESYGPRDTEFKQAQVDQDIQRLLKGGE